MRGAFRPALSRAHRHRELACLDETAAPFGARLAFERLFRQCMPQPQYVALHRLTKPLESKSRYDVARLQDE